MKSTEAHKHLFYAEMAKLLEAGFGIREAADVLAGTGLPKFQESLLRDLQSGLLAGRSITDSIAGNQAVVSDFERGIIGAGERSGRLPQAMRHLAEYFEMLATAKRDLIKGLIHPIIILHLGIFIGTVPSGMLDAGQSRDGLIFNFFATLLAAYALGFAIFMLCRSVLRAAKVNPGVDAILRRVPLLGKTRTHLAMSAFCKVYHTCLLAGIPMRETVTSSANASQSGLILDASTRLLETLAQGNPLGPAMSAESAFPKVFSRTYATGEAAGTLDRDLANWARQYHSESLANARTLSAAIPRIFYLIILCYVGWQIVGFYNHYYSSLLKELE
jgi:type IV pilus assembly protein PilC